MTTWPTTKATTTYLDQGTDSPRLARPELKQNVDNVNDIIDMFNIASPTNNQILKYSTAAGRFELATDTSTGITLVGDDSTGTLISDGETFKIAGAGNITTAVSGDTITITGTEAQSIFQTIAVAGQSSVVADTATDTLTLAAGSNISITTNAGTDTITIAGTDTNTTYSISAETVSGGANLRLTDSAAGTDDVKIAGGTNVTVTRTDANTITIAAAATGIASVSADTDPTLGGNLKVGGYKITSTSNGNIVIEPNGTGEVILGDDFTAANLDNYTNASNSFPAFGDAATIKNNLLFTSNLAVPNITQFSERHFNNVIYSYGKADSSSTTYNDTDFRWGNSVLSLFDMAGATADSTVTGSRSAAIRGIAVSTGYKNSGGGTKTTPNQVGLTAFNEIQEGHGGDLTVVNQMGARVGNSVRANTGEYSRITNSIGYIADTISTGGTGANNTNRFITNEYGFYDAPTTASSLITNHYGYYVHTGSSATNKYAFYSADDTYQSRIGTLERYLEKINALTSSSTITVDADLAPVHKVTLGVNTQFGISNLSTGQTVTLIIVQDGTGSRTATFTSDTSTAVKFAGGTPALTTTANAIDIVTIFNDGTNLYGNIAKAYA